MPFKVSALTVQPNFESLTVAKITDYPLEKRDYKPFAQGRLCITPQSLIVQLWAFEVNPSPHSSLKAVFSPAGSPDVFFSAELISTGSLEATITLDGHTASFVEHGFTPPTLEPFWGEDLQGVYWGGTITFFRKELERLCGDDSLTPGAVLYGNLYKLSTDPEKPHSGSLFPADFAGGKPFDHSSLGEFQIVSY